MFGWLPDYISDLTKHLLDPRSPWATFWTTLTGTLVGGAITYLVQVANARRARKERATAKDEDELASAISLVLRVTKMYSNLSSAKVQIDQAIAASKVAGKPLEWTGLPAFVGETPPIDYTSDERRVLVTALRRVAVGTLELADMHNDFVALVETYSKQRIELALILPMQQQDGYRGASELSLEEHKRLTPRFIMLNSLTDALVERSSQDFAHSEDVFTKVRAACQERWGKRFPSIELQKRGPSN